MELVQVNNHTRVIQGSKYASFSDREVGLTTLTTLKMQTRAFRYIVAGHGEIYEVAEQANRAIDYTAERLEGILEHVRSHLPAEHHVCWPRS